MVSGANVLLRAPAASVNVGFTLAPGEIDVHSFELGVEIDGYTTHFAHAYAGGLHPAERKLRFAADGRRIHVGDAGLDALDELKDFRGVIRIKGAGESIADGIGDVEGFVKITHANYGEHRTENLFLRDS